MKTNILMIKQTNVSALYIYVIMLVISIGSPLHSNGVILSDTIPQTKNTTLKEVVVEAKDIIKKDDKYIIYPSKANKEKSLEAIELVGNLDLPGVFMDKRTDNLTSIRGGNIGYCINGVQVTDKEFRTVHPSLIKRVEYHIVPSSRFGDVDYVIDIYVKRSHFGFSGIFNERQSLGKNDLKGIYRNSLKMNYGKSEFTLFGHYEYGKFNGYSYRQYENLIFSNGSYMYRDFQTLPYRMNEQYLDAFAAYSYMSNDHFFFVKLLYNNFNTPTTEKNGDLNVLNKSAEEESIEHLREYQTDCSWDKRTSADLYYQRKLKTKGLFMFDAVYTFLKAENTSKKLYIDQTEHSSNLAAYEANGRKHSIISQLKFDQPIASGNFSIGLKLNWNKSFNNYNGSVESVIRQTRIIYEGYCEWRGKLNKINYSLGVKSKTSSIKNEPNHIKETNIIPNLMVMMDLNKNFSLRVIGSLKSTNSNLGNSSTAIIQTGQYTYIAGNSELKPSLSYNANLSLSYFTRKLFSDLDISFIHTDSPLMNDIKRVNNAFISSTINGNFSNMLHIASSSRVYILGRTISLTPRFGYNFNQYSCSNYKNQLHTWWFKGGINYTLQKFDFSIDYYKDAEVLAYGLKRINKYQTIGLSINYRINKVRFSISASQPLSTKQNSVKVKSDIYDSMVITSTTLRPLVFLQVSWSLYKGKQNNHIEKKLNNEDVDNGLL